MRRSILKYGLVKLTLEVCTILVNIAEHQIPSCIDEINDIILLLDEQAKEELKYIWRVDVYNANEQIHCQSEEGLIYNDSIACENSTSK